MESFQRTAHDGWRYSVSYRTRRTARGWMVERWNGECWDHVGRGTSYADARRVATDDHERRVRDVIRDHSRDDRFASYQADHDVAAVAAFVAARCTCQDIGKNVFDCAMHGEHLRASHEAQVAKDEARKGDARA